MGISPWYKTSVPTAPTWTIQLVPDSGVFNVSGLTTANFALLVRNLDSGQEGPGQGTFSAITAAVTTTSSGITVILAPASVQYQVAAAEVVLGRYRIWVLVTLSGGQVQPFLLEEDWQVVSL